MGINVAVRIETLPEELHATAASLGLERTEVEPVLRELLATLERTLALDGTVILERWRERDVLRGRAVTWADGAGTAAGIDADGRLLVDLDSGDQVALDSGEVHLGAAGWFPNAS
jgi:biotin-(acetyl-CoA carboxylase) ligase